MKQLTGHQTQLLRDALASAYPTIQSLREMLWTRLEVNLDDVATGDNRAALLFNLIKLWAEARSRTEDLIKAARADNPDNEALRNVAQLLGVEPLSDTPDMLTEADARRVAQFLNPPTLPLGRDPAAYGTPGRAAPPGDRAPAPAPLLDPWPTGPLITPEVVAAAQAEAASTADDNMYKHLGRVYLRHIVAHQDVRRDLTRDVLQQLDQVSTARGLRFQLIRGNKGNGKSAFLLRLAYELEQRGAYVLLVQEEGSIDDRTLRQVCAAVAQETERTDRHVYLLIDDVYRYQSYIRLLKLQDASPVDNLIIIASSRYTEVPQDAGPIGTPLTPEVTDLLDLNPAEAEELVAHIQQWGMLNAANPTDVVASVRAEGEPLLVAVARLTRTGGLETDVENRLSEMNRGTNPRGLAPGQWTEFLQVYYAIALCHAWGADIPQPLIAALTEGRLTGRRVNVLLCTAFTATLTDQAREYLRGTCRGTWRTDHELIAIRAVRLLADELEPPLERFTWLLTALAAGAGDPAHAPEAATLAGVLLRRAAETPDLLFPDATTPLSLDPLPPIRESFTVPSAPPTPRHAQLAAALDTPALAGPLATLRGLAAAPALLSTYANAYLLLCRWDDVLATTAVALQDPHTGTDDQVAAYWTQNLAFSGLKQYQAALDSCSRAIALRPDSADLLNGRAGIYEAMQQYGNALADYTRALTLRPSDPDLWKNRGSVYFRLQRYWAEQPPEPVNTYATLYHYEDALADYNQSLALRPDDPDTLSNRAAVYASLGRIDEAQADLERSLQQHPTDATALYNLACFYSLRGDGAAALTALQTSIAGDESNRALAQTDPDFAPLRDNPAFRALVGLPPLPAT
jgi:tetratricopeptide (TPR) repeat protein